jgi:DNA-binding transcriptional ArsR family regulator
MMTGESKRDILTPIDIKIFRKLIDSEEASFKDLTDFSKNSIRDIRNRLNLLKDRGLVKEEKVKNMNKRKIWLVNKFKDKIRIVLELFES